MNSYLEICEAGSSVSCYVEGLGADITELYNKGGSLCGVVLGALAVIAVLYFARWLLKRVKS